MLSSDEVVDAGEVFCVSDLAEMVSLSSVGDSDKMSIVEVIVEFWSDTGELVDISVLDAPWRRGTVLSARCTLSDRRGTFLQTGHSSDRRGSWRMRSLAVAELVEGGVGRGAAENH